MPQQNLLDHDKNRTGEANNTDGTVISGTTPNGLIWTYTGQSGHSVIYNGHGDDSDHSESAYAHVVDTVRAAQ